MRPPRARVLLAPDSFGGFRSAAEVCALMADGVERGASEAGVSVAIERMPMADGGAGTLEVLHAANGGELRDAGVKDPLGIPIRAQYLSCPDGRAVIEMARASGLDLVRETEARPDRRQPFHASTFGTGELILAAYGEGHRRMLVTVGGSATNDGGVGAAQALGVRLMVGPGRELGERRVEGYGAAALLLARSADFTRRLSLADVELVVAVDVDSPLLGPTGATAVYGAQKGVTAAMRPPLEEALGTWAGWVEAVGGAGLRDLPGCGAAGGLAFALAGLFGAKLAGGSSLVADALGLSAAIERADLVITGEGRIDSQTFQRKVVHEVVDRVRRAVGRPAVVAIGGSVVEQEIPLECRPDLLLDASRVGDPTDLSGRRAWEPGLRHAAREAINWWLRRTDPGTATE